VSRPAKISISFCGWDAQHVRISIAIANQVLYVQTYQDNHFTNISLQARDTSSKFHNYIYLK